MRLRDWNKKRMIFKNQEKERILDEEYTKRLEGEICKKVEKSQNTDEAKLEMKSTIEDWHRNLINGVTLQLQKEKEDNIQEG